MSLLKRIGTRAFIGVPAPVVRTVSSGLPGPLRGQLRQSRERMVYHRFVKTRLRGFFQETDPGPLPPTEFIMRTFVLDEKEVSRKTNQYFYFQSGYRQMRAILEVAERHGLNLRTLRSILELGAGSARLIRHLRCFNGIRLVGTDVNKEMATWCAENLPGIEFHTNALKPPLTFAEENAFDLIYASSVFTHIPLETQGLWIRELHRILRPGGLAIVDVLGAYHQERMLSPQDQDRLRKDKQLEITSTDDRASLSTKVIGSWDVFQTRGENLRVFGSVFEVVDYLPVILDLLVLRKPGRA